MSKLTIISFASKNPERQAELKRGIKEISGGKQIDLVFAESEADVIRALPDAEIMLCHGFAREILKSAKRLKWIQRTDAGIEQTLFPELVESEIILTNARGIHGRYMAEWTLAALLHISQGFMKLDGWLRNREWSESKKEINAERFTLDSRRVLIVGYGEVGRPVGELLSAIGMQCEGMVTTPREDEIALHGIERLPEMIGEFDVVVIATPLTKRTEHLFDRSLLSKMKAGSILLNLARGKVVDEAALIDALKQGPLSYAALDVFREEPLPADSPLFEIPNLLMTPHVSGNFPDYAKQIHALFIDNVHRYLKGEPLRFVVDKRRGY